MSDDKFEIDIQKFAKALQSGQGLNGKRNNLRHPPHESSNRKGSCSGWPKL